MNVVTSFMILIITALTQQSRPGEQLHRFATVYVIASKCSCKEKQSRASIFKFWIIRNKLKLTGQNLE